MSIYRHRRRLYSISATGESTAVRIAGAISALPTRPHVAVPPRIPRMAYTSSDTGFTSTKTRSQPGMVEESTKTFDAKVSGIRNSQLKVITVPGVRYFSVAGDCSGPWLGMPWRLPHGIVRAAEGPNDGVVAVSSARWGEHCEVWGGDHLNLINWPNRPARAHGISQDRLSDWGRLVGRLRDCGF